MSYINLTFFWGATNFAIAILVGGVVIHKILTTDVSNVTERKEKLLLAPPLNPYLVTCLLIYSFCFALFVSHHPENKIATRQIIDNCIAITVICAFLEITRLLPIYNSARRGKSSDHDYRRVALDFAGNTMILISLYCSTLARDKHTWIAATILLFWHFFRLFRVYIIVEPLLFNKFRIKDAEMPSILYIFYKGMVESVLKIIVFSIFGFAVACMLISGPEAMVGEGVINDDFHISHPSGNSLVDFIYFGTITITTLGYGDISPKSIPAKITCSLFIVFSYIILVSIVGMTVGLISSNVKFDTD